VEAGVLLVPLRYEGATWGKAKSKFPDVDADYIQDQVTVEGVTFQVRPVLRKLFSIKTIEHSREYFSGFMDRLIQQLPKI
jgi:hypothetical protein